jgi:hypothetical protein
MQDDVSYSEETCISFPYHLDMLTIVKVNEEKDLCVIISNINRKKHALS